LKAEAERILNELGLDASDATRVFYKQEVLRKGERARSGNRPRFERAMAKVKDRSPESKDRM
jgi:hypothetical protein